jgi:hypothetical protein
MDTSTGAGDHYFTLATGAYHPPIGTPVQVSACFHDIQDNVARLYTNSWR